MAERQGAELSSLLRSLSLYAALTKYVPSSFLPARPSLMKATINSSGLPWKQQRFHPIGSLLKFSGGQNVYSSLSSLSAWYEQAWPLIYFTLTSPQLPQDIPWQQMEGKSFSSLENLFISLFIFMRCLSRRKVILPVVPSSWDSPCQQRERR